VNIAEIKFPPSLISVGITAYNMQNNYQTQNEEIVFVDRNRGFTEITHTVVGLDLIPIEKLLLKKSALFSKNG